jgi:hypothetical protein
MLAAKEWSHLAATWALAARRLALYCDGHAIASVDESGMTNRRGADPRPIVSLSAIWQALAEKAVRTGWPASLTRSGSIHERCGRTRLSSCIKV